MVTAYASGKLNLFKDFRCILDSRRFISLCEYRHSTTYTAVKVKVKGKFHPKTDQEDLEGE
jgi:hypothetical protein